uniref:Uncharacterized protein n=1 Tax=Nelumbo nucifera TaxID=4432 RepID=A0A822YVZ6_NELNU|nr:TPA_asm: hypothetical protein HUJ06_005935 [Nelumbo nucifera]
MVNGGSIIEIGSHNELINKTNGHYARLEKLQRQFSCDDIEQTSKLRRMSSSVARSSAGRLSINKSPASFLSPFLVKNPLPVSYPPPSFTQLLLLNSLEWKNSVMGSLSAIIFGAVQPVYAITIGGMISAFFVQSHKEMRAQIRTYSLIFFSLSLISILHSNRGF